MRVAGWLVLLSGLTCACGGRYDRLEQDSGTGIGGAATGMPEPPMLAEPGPAPFAVPPWIGFRWSPRVAEVASICEAAWSPEEAQVALEQHNTAFYGARLVDSDELAELLALPELPNAERALHLFPLPEGETGAILVKDDGDDTSFMYLRIDATCRLQLLSSYTRRAEAVGCDEPARGFRMWDVPGPSFSYHICDASNVSGYYAFQAEVLLDDCALTPHRFVGAFGFSETVPNGGAFWFADLAGHPATQGGFELYFSGGRASTTRGDSGECTRRFTELSWRTGERLDLSDERVICDDAGERTCGWRIEGTQIFGPL